MNREMFYGAKPEIFARALMLRENMTHAEKMLWQCLKENKLGVRFKPQHPIDIFIADFYCHQIKLVIEIDGEIHKKKKEYDEGRTAELQHYEIEVMRFSNDEIENSLEKVIEKIKNKIDERRLSLSAL